MVAMFGDAALKDHAGDAAMKGDANLHRFCKSCHVYRIQPYDITYLMMYTVHDSLPIWHDSGTQIHGTDMPLSSEL